MSNKRYNLIKEDVSGSQTTNVNFLSGATAKLVEICNLLMKENISNDDIGNILDKMNDYIKEYERIIYSVISNYIFTNCEDNNINILQTNIDKICDCILSSNYGKTLDELLIKKSVLKLYDHVNLAIYQYYSLKANDTDFSRKIGENIAPVRRGIDNQLKDFEKTMTSQLISILGIFTAISFIVFGGISSASSILSNISKLSMVRLILLASIWGLAICNLVFFLLYFMAKLSKISIKTNPRPGANICRRHPYIVIINFVLGSILVLSLWGCLVEITTGVEWLKAIVNNNKDFLLIGTVILISAIIIMFIVILFKVSDNKNDWRY